MGRRRKDAREARRHGAAVDRSLRSQLFDGEQVVLVARPGRIATLPKLVATLGMYSFWRRRDSSVLTDERVLLGKGFLRRSERSIPLAAIDDVAFARSGLNSYADVSFHGQRTHGVKRIGPMSPRTAHRFAREMLRRI